MHIFLCKIETFYNFLISLHVLRALTCLFSFSFDVEDIMFILNMILHWIKFKDSDPRIENLPVGFDHPVIKNHAFYTQNKIPVSIPFHFDPLLKFGRGSQYDCTIVVDIFDLCFLRFCNYYCDEEDSDAIGTET